MQKLLIVDDSDVTRHSLEWVLKRHIPLIAIDSVADGASAIDLAKVETPNVILLDMMMPVLDGVSTIRAISKLNLNIHIVMVTALGQHHPIVRTGFESGAKTYFSKNDRLENLIAILYPLFDANNFLAAQA